MTPRERILSIGVGAAIVFGVGCYGWSSIRKGFDAKSKRIAQLESEKKKREASIEDGMLDRNKLNAVTDRSLPSNIEQASADYRKWMVEWIKDSKLTTPTQQFITTVGKTPQKGVYTQLKFSISGQGTIENLTDLLYSYYQKNYLHRISSMRISIVPRETYQLKIELTTDVLALDNAPKIQPNPPGNSPLMAKAYEEYYDSIVGRNLFSTANHPPQWSQTASTEAVRGSPFNFDPGAKDSDAGQKVYYEVIGDVPEGLRISRSGTEINWVPDQLGSYVVDLRVTDTGLPRRWSEQKLTINVVEPPPVPQPKPTLDIAAQAEVSALVSGRDGPAAWVKSKIEGKTIYLKVGDKLTLGSVEGTVIAVGANYMELETNGQRWTVGLDESLADAYQRVKVN